MAEGEAERRKVHGCAYYWYSIVMFFAHWFEPRRFDTDGDRDFDPEDAQAYLAEKGFLKLNPNTIRRPKKRRSDTSRSAKPSEKQDEHPQTEDPNGGGDGKVNYSDVMEEQHVKQIAPWFITFESVVVLVLWFFFAVQKAAENGGDPLQMMAGLDSLKPGFFTLSVASREDCEDYRTQAWRWITYQFTHVGAMHVVTNIFLTVTLGIPLEGLHGHVRTALMFNVGVVGGACFYLLSDAHTIVVGCSGGCYALIGVHLADFVVDWRKFRISKFLFLLVLIVVDVCSYVTSIPPENASYSVRIGGGLVGLLIGCTIVRNRQKTPHEKVITVVMTILGLGLAGSAIAWTFLQEAGPRNMWEAQTGVDGWCWFRQLYSRSTNEWEWECIRCGTRACIDRWSSGKYRIERASFSFCNSQGNLYSGR